MEHPGKMENRVRKVPSVYLEQREDVVSEVSLVSVDQVVYLDHLEIEENLVWVVQMDPREHRVVKEIKDMLDHLDY